MAHKPFTTRTAMITTVSAAVGSAAGTAAESIAAHVGYPVPGVGSTLTAVTTLWMLGKLNALIDEDK